MANFFTKLTTILFLATLLFHSQTAFSEIDDVDEDNDDVEEYVLDSPIAGLLGRSRSRFLMSVIKKGTRCDAADRKHRVCDGVTANKGKSLLFCCKKHCRNVLGDRNNCGICGHKCRLDQRCCGGQCTDVLFNRSHCGKCERQCKRGVACGYGVCGYA